jgi:hypothetical protein
VGGHAARIGEKSSGENNGPRDTFFELSNVKSQILFSGEVSGTEGRSIPTYLPKRKDFV